MTANWPPIPVRDDCRVCGFHGLTKLFSLGEQFVSDFVDHDKIQSGVKCPIELELCRRCSLVQLRHTAPQELLYSRRYWYRSGITSTMHAALRDVAAATERAAGLKAGDVVCDIGSNDGLGLRSYRVPGLIKVGVEPADNLVEAGSVGLDHLIHDFWGTPTALKAYWDRVGKPAQAIMACGMLYDLDSPGAFIADVAKVLHPDGVFIAQLMCLQNMFNVGDVGNFAHEHLLYFSLRSLEYLFGAHGLVMVDLETNQVNGESYRLYVKHGNPAGCRGNYAPRLLDAFVAESRLDHPDVYTQFFNRMEVNKMACVDFIRREVDAGKRVAVYGASTKGNVILQYYGLDHTLISFAADRSPDKFGKFTIGTGIPIRSLTEARIANPDFFLVLPYSFITEFVELEKDATWRQRGGKFIVPLPDFRVI